MRVFVPAVLVLASAAVFASRETEPRPKGAVGSATGKLQEEANVDRSLIFEPNRGQTAAEVRYLARAAGYTVFLTDREAVSAFFTRVPEENRLAYEFPEQAVLRMEWKGGARLPRTEPLVPLPGHSSYFIGNDPSKWRTGVPQYAKVRYADVYPGVDLVYYGASRNAEYDFVVKPGGDPGRIHLAYSGMEKMELAADGALVFRFGEHELRQHRPRVYQSIGGHRVELAASYTVTGNEVGFAVARYDKGHPLVIDPVLEYSNFVGGSSTSGGGSASTGGAAIAVDDSGATYLTGRTSAANFPANTTPANRQGYQGGEFDAFVTKFSANGGAILYAAYLGGTGNDGGTVLSVDAGGQVTFAGYTGSGNFPVTQGVLDNTLGGAQDSFAAKLDSAGASLGYSTYYGGPGVERADGLRVEPTGVITISGTGGQSIPEMCSTGCVQQSASSDAAPFVARFTAQGSGVTYSTYVGNRSTPDNTKVFTDGSGARYVCGSTGPEPFPIAGNVDQSGYGGGFLNVDTLGRNDGFGSSDVFISKIAPNGQSMVWSTYLGGNGNERCAGIVLDGNGSVYVAGNVFFGAGGGNTFPTTTGAFQRNFGGGTNDEPSGPSDIFLAKLNPDGRRVWVTLIGGAGNDFARSLTLDSNGLPVVAGWTRSTNFPVANKQAIQNRGGAEAVVFKMNTGGNKMVFSSIFGGSNGDSIAGLAVRNDEVYAVGTTTVNTQFPNAKSQPTRSYSGAATDGFVAKLANANLNLRPRVLGDAGRAVGDVANFQGGIFGCNISVDNTTAGNAADQTRINASAGAGNRILSCDGQGATCTISGDGSSAEVVNPSLGGGQSMNVNISVEAVNSGVQRECTFSGGADPNDPDLNNNNTSVNDGVGTTGPAPGVPRLIASISPELTSGQVNAGGLPYTGPRDFAPGQQVQVEAVARAGAGCWFDGFAGDLTGYTNPQTLVMNGPRTILARFACPSFRPPGSPLGKIGFFRQHTSQPPQAGQPWGMFLLDATGDGGWQGDQQDRLFWLGQGGDVPVTGDWNGDGRTKIGIFRNGLWLLDMNGNGRWDGDQVDRIASIGQAGDKPVVGDWNGDGRTKVGAFRPAGPDTGLWVIDYNGNGRWDSEPIDKAWRLGLPGGDIPVVGDWNNNGKTKIGIFRPWGADQGMWLLDYDGSGGWSGNVVDRQYYLGQGGDTPVVGRWEKFQGHRIGVFRGLNATQAMWLLDLNGNGRWDGDGIDWLRIFGQTGDTPVVADWDSGGRDRFGIFRAGLWVIDYNGDGFYTPGVDRVASLGQAGDTPLVGIW